MLVSLLFLVVSVSAQESAPQPTPGAQQRVPLWTQLQTQGLVQPGGQQSTAQLQTMLNTYNQQLKSLGVDPNAGAGTTGTTGGAQATNTPPAPAQPQPQPQAPTSAPSDDGTTRAGYQTVTTVRNLGVTPPQGASAQPLDRLPAGDANRQLNPDEAAQVEKLQQQMQDMQKAAGEMISQ